MTQTLEFADTIEGFVESCGLNLRWDISGTVDRTFFFDQDDNVVRTLDKVREDNKITNLDTGESLQEGPDSFIQMFTFNDDGSVTLEINGLSVLVNQGENSVVDAGRVVAVVRPERSHRARHLRPARHSRHRSTHRRRSHPARGVLSRIHLATGWRTSDGTLGPDRSESGTSGDL